MVILIFVFFVFVNIGFGNLLNNPGFEDRTEDFSPWKKHPTMGNQVAIYAISSEQKHTGGYSLKISSSPSGGSVRNYCVIQPVTVFAGKSYKASVYVYSTDVSKGAGLIIKTSTIGWNAVWPGVAESTYTTTNSSSWQYLEISTKILNGVSTIYVHLNIRISANSSGVAYFDNVIFEPIPPAPPTNLKALHCGSFVSLSWIHSQDYSEDNFVGYRIYRSTNGENFVLISTTSNTNFKDENQIDKRTKYYYYLCTFDDLNVESEKSNIAEASPDLISPGFVLVSKLTSRDLGKQVAKVNLKVVDDRFQEGDRQGSLVSLEGKFKEILSGEERNVRFNPEFISGTTEYIGCAEFDFTLINLSNKGIKYQFCAKDEVNTSYYPSENEWVEVLPPQDKPEQKFITPKNPEVIFGSEVEEVIIRDSQGNELWAEKVDSSNKIIVWRGKDKNGKSLESGAYIYQIKTKEGKRKYGVVIVVK